MKKIFRIFLIIMFPLGIIYCVGRALFTGKDFASYIGMIFILGLGILLGVYFCNPEMVKGWLQTIGSLFKS